MARFQDSNDGRSRDDGARRMHDGGDDEGRSGGDWERWGRSEPRGRGGSRHQGGSAWRREDEEYGRGRSGWRAADEGYGHREGERLGYGREGRAGGYGDEERERSARFHREGRMGGRRSDEGARFEGSYGSPDRDDRTGGYGYEDRERRVGGPSYEEREGRRGYVDRRAFGDISGEGRAGFRGRSLDEGRISFGERGGPGHRMDEEERSRMDRGDRSAYAPGWSRAGGGEEERSGQPGMGPGRRPDEPPMRGRFYGKGPKGYQRSDERIREDICDRLTEHPGVDATEIEIEVKGGEVRLSGTVESREQKRLAEEIAEDVLGVKDVQNAIRLMRPGGERTENGERSQRGAQMVGNIPATAPGRQ